MPLPMVVTYKAFRLDCGHEAPAMTWLEAEPTEMLCRICGEVRRVLRPQIGKEHSASTRKAA